MDLSDAAAVGRFPIGPASALGRVIALRVLLCGSAGEALRICWLRGHRSLAGRAMAIAGALRFRRSHALLALAIAVALLLRRKLPSLRARMRRARRRASWQKVMKSACTYDEWCRSAAMLEKESPPRQDSALYDEGLVRAKLVKLRRRREEGEVQDILFCLRTDLLRNLGNMCNPDLHKGRLQVPFLIQEYIDEVRHHLRMVTDSQSKDLPLEEKLAFIHETRHAFGRTALLLSGGSSLGAFHIGVVKTLIQHHLLPRVVAGASVGSIICSAIATRTWPELQSFFGDDMPSLEFFDQSGGIFTILNRIFTKGVVHEIRQLQYLLRKYTLNLTFQEAYDMTGRVLGVSVCSPRKHEPPRCLNYLTSPHVLIWSAVTASCAFPGLFEAQELMAKDRHGRLVPYHTAVHVDHEEQVTGMRCWRDGSLESDLPMLQLKELFNVNHFIVSQANPHVAPILRIKEVIRAYVGDSAAKLAHLVEMEVKHRCRQMLEIGFPIHGLAKVVAQDWEGDITFVMPATVAQLARLIQNPTPSDLEIGINQGRRCTWEKLSVIEANCGIELMLDQCVSELNQLRRIKRSLERSSVHLTTMTVPPALGTKIPSWNCLERESSWGSLDEDGVAEISSAAGGPWVCPSFGAVKPLCNNHSESDSEAENESVSFSWTRAGGPLMRTASAVKFIQDYGGKCHGNLNPKEISAQESLDNAVATISPDANV